MRYNYFYDRLKNNKTVIVLLLILILGFFLRLYHLGYRSLMWPELCTAGRIDYTLVQTVKNLFGTRQTPLYYIMMNSWVKFFGNSEFSLRFPSLIFSVLSIIFIFKLAKELFNEKVGLISALLLSVSPYSILFAQHAKMYSMLWCLGILSFLFFHRFTKNNEMRNLLSYVVFTTASIYTMYIGFIFIIVQNILFFAFPDNVKKCRRWILGQLMIILLYLPWMDKIFYNRSSIREFVIWGHPKIDNYFLFFKRIFFQTTGILGENLYLRQLEFFLYLFLIIAAVVYFRNIRKKKQIFDFTRNDSLLFAWIIIPVIIYSIIDIFLFRIFMLRYAGFIHIPLIILFSKGLNKFNVKVKSAILLFLLIMIFSNHLYPWYHQTTKYGQDWRGLVNLLREKTNKNAQIFGGPAKHLRYYTENKFEVKPLRHFMKQKGIDEKYDSIFIIYTYRQKEAIKKAVPKGYKLKEDYSLGSVGYLQFIKAQNSDMQNPKKKNRKAAYIDSEEKSMKPQHPEGSLRKGE